MKNVELQWQRSSCSGLPDADRIELASRDGRILLRESARPAVVTETSPESLRALLATLKSGKLSGLS